MKKFVWTVLGVVVVAAGVFGVMKLTEKRAEEKEQSVAEDKSVEEVVEEWMGQMDLKTKIGQMIIITNEEGILLLDREKKQKSSKP